MSQLTYGLSRRWAHFRARGRFRRRAIGLWAADVTAAVLEWRRFWWRRMRSWRPGRAIGLWAADVTAAVLAWRRFWWRRMRSWRPGRAIGLWAADVRSGLMQVRPRTLGLATGIILLCSMALGGLLTMGGGSVPRALGGAFTVEVDESGQPYVALDPQALGDGGSTRAGGRSGEGSPQRFRFSR